jgi:hypothetical protein
MLNLRERHHLEDPGVDGRLIIRWVFKKWDVEGMDWIELVQDRLPHVLNIRVP